ncbi:hypothetical protein EB118_14025 [bacterium]|nr:hypothetical protein [bacterium]NDC95481.1 hypothetical protein [bacterium]NDD85217.1 hypothetical protein [bacterium]NDG31173.1 hypothetical protein [bacterium]
MQLQLSDVIHGLKIMGILIIGALAIYLLITIIRKVLAFIISLRQTYAVIELVPPAFRDKPPEANKTLMRALHGLGLSRSLLHKLIGVNSLYSLEIVSTRKEGIRYIVRVPEASADMFRRVIASHVPDVATKIINDPLDAYNNDKFRLLRFRQSSHYMYPLIRYERDDTHDPMSYITGAMTKLADNELIVYQVCVSPRRLRGAKRLKRKVLANEELINHYRRRLPPALGAVGGVINQVLFGMADFISMAFHPDTQPVVSRKDVELQRKSESAKHIKPERSLSFFELEMVDEISKKLDQPHFATSIRACVFTESSKESSERANSLASAMSLYTNEKLQRLVTKKYRIGISKKLQLWELRKRIIGDVFRPMYLSSEELAGMYHFPHSEHAKTENIVKSLAKTLPATISLKNGTALDVLIGENHHHGQVTPIGLTEAERQRHMYVIGGTGNGKTTMLKYQIVQDILSGKGLAVIDPHGDLAEELLGYIPEERMKDVIYINPDDLSHPVGINLLELPEGISGDDLLREKDIVTESTVSVLRKIFSEDDSGGHRIEYVLRNTIQTALTMDEANLFTIFRLLNDAKYRKGVVNNLENEDLKIFWKNEIGKAGEMQRVKMAAGITAKIGRFLFSASAKRILEQNKSTVNFDTAMDEKKIIICNFSKGLLGEDTSMLFGVTVLAKMQLASLRRARQSHGERSPYYLYVDEFQNFATMSFVQMLSEARKYKLFLVMAEQSTQQQVEQRLVDIILANVGTIIAFRSGSPADERLILPLFKPFIEENELSNLPAYSFYARISAINAQEPISGRTVVLSDEPDKDMASKIKDLSRQTYGTVVKPVDNDLASDKTIVAENKPNKPKKKSSRKRQRIEEFAS